MTEPIKDKQSSNKSKNKTEKIFTDSAQRIYKSLNLKMNKKDKEYTDKLAKRLANI